MAPAIPVVWEAMDHDDERALTDARIMNFHAIIVCIAMFSFVQQVSMDCIRNQYQGDECG
jgi:hypothetical protein